MRQPSTEHLRLGLAVLLIFTPLWGPALGLTGPTYTYESAEIRVEDNRLVVPDRDARSELWHGIDGFACSVGSSVTRYCALEAATLNGTLAVDHPDVQSSSSGHLDVEERYLAYYDGRVFERESTWEDGRYVLSTARVPAAAALDEVARTSRPIPDRVDGYRERVGDRGPRTLADGRGRESVRSRRRLLPRLPDRRGPPASVVAGGGGGADVVRGRSRVGDAVRPRR